MGIQNNKCEGIEVVTDSTNCPMDKLYVQCPINTDVCLQLR